MKISKPLLKVIAIAITVGATANACNKEITNSLKKKDATEQKHGAGDCPTCGLG